MLNVVVYAATLSALPSSPAQAIGLSEPYIVGGEPVGTCGWPTAVDVNGGCTGTLIHSKAITTAQHCNPGAGQAVNLGETRGQVQATEIERCYSTGSDDAAICELRDEITGIPVTPILFGCEVETYMKVGQAVVITGYGALSSDSGQNRDKYWAAQTLTAVEEKRVIIGDAGDGVSPCPGDSGGPVFVKVNDGSYRVFGTVWKGTTGIPCNSAAEYQRPDVLVAGFEKMTGLDITPCFDGQSGAWDPSPSCTGFFAGDQSNAGSWEDWCADTPKSGPSEECGASDSTGSDETSSDQTHETSSTDEDLTSTNESTSASDTTGESEETGTSTSTQGEQSEDSQNSADTSTDPESGDDDDDDGEHDSSATDEKSDGPSQDEQKTGCGCQSTPRSLSFGAAIFWLVRWRRRNHR